MKKVKQILAAFLCVAMLFTMNGVTVTASQKEAYSTPGEGEISEKAEESGGDTQTDQKEQAVRANMLLTYLVFGDHYIETPGQQYVLAGIGDGTYNVERAVLHYKNQTTKAAYTAEADTLLGDAALFYLDFADESFTGSYEVTAIEYTAQGVSGTIQIGDTGIEACFGVNQAVETKPDAVTTDEVQLEDAASTLITDAEGNVLSGQDLSEVISNANRSVGNTGAVRATGAGNLVVVLDPGHGGTDPGAVRTINGITYQERDLVLKIANYCKAELETYSGVTVYMTRTDNTSPTESRQDRVNKAAKWDADILVSFHLNSTTANIDSANGAAVYIPNANYNQAYDYNGVGKELGNKILAQLKKLGLANNGTKLDEGQNGTYADGSVADNLGINYWSKYYQYKFAGILIEHAFINNYNDVVYHLSSEAKLKELGVADAAGIADYYGLSKGGDAEWSYLTSVDSGSVKLVWKPAAGVTGYQIYRSDSQNGKYTRIATMQGADTVTYTDKGLAEGTAYYYKIRTYTGSSNGKFSAVKSAYPLGSTGIRSVVSEASGRLKITWEQVPGAQRYYLYRSTNPAGGFQKLATISSGDTVTYTDTTVKKGTTYYYKVKAGSKQNGKEGYGTTSAAANGWSVAAAGITGVSSSDEGGLLVKWKGVTGIYRYQVYRSTSRNGTYKKVATVKGTSYLDTKAALNKKYFYKIRTTNRVNGVTGYGTFSKVKYGMQVGAASITSVKTISSTSLRISWKKVSNAAGYKVYRSTSRKGNYRLVKNITNGSTTRFTNKKLGVGTTYYYKVQAVGNTGGYTGVGKFSKVVSGRTAAATTFSYAQSVSSRKLKLSWKKIEGADGYKIARSTSAGGSYQVIKTIPSGETVSYTDQGLKTGRAYYYKVAVRKLNNGIEGWSEYSPAIKGKTAGSPAIQSIKSVSSAAVQLSWTKASGAAGYQVYRSTEEKKGYKRLATISSAGAVSYKDVPPEANVTYYYKVRSYNKNNGKTGYSEYTPPVAAKSIAVPRLNAVTQNADSSLKISWKRVSGAVKYSVYRRENGAGTYKKIADIKSSSGSYNDTNVVSGVKYEYKVIAYNKVNGVTGSSGYSAPQSYSIALYEIMGEAETTVEQMISYYKTILLAMQLTNPLKGYAYPASVYKEKGAEDIETFAQIVYEEAVVEGVKPEVVFAQICNETYFLQFGGDVKVEQCNFAGLGATGDGEPGNTFENVRTGIRAQVQHLKAYASNEALVKPCVDPRFRYVKRGTAKYVEWLGIQENPNTKWNADGTVASGCGWATAKNYGYTLMNGVNKIKKF